MARNKEKLNSLKAKEKKKTSSKEISLPEYHNEDSSSEGEETTLPKRRETPIGLDNVGNTCYFNTILQILFNNKKFRIKILELDFPALESENSFKEVELDIKFLVELKRIFLEMSYSPFKSVNPTILLTLVRNDEGNHINVGEFLDMMEINCWFMDQLDRSLKLFYNILKGMGIKISKKNRIKPNKMFKTKTITETYIEGNQEKLKEEKEHSLSLFVNPINDYLEIVLSDIFSSPKEIQFDCSVIDLKNNNRKQVTWIERLPRTLFISANRLTWDKVQQRCVKINSKLLFKEKLDMGKFLIKFKNTILEHERKKLKQFYSKERAMGNLDSLQRTKSVYENDLNIFSALGFFIDTIKSQDKYKAKNSPLFNEAYSKIDLGLLEQLLKDHKKERRKLEEKIKRIEAWNDKELDFEFNKKSYVLKSIVMHEGSVYSGHYYLFVKNEFEDWYRISDTNYKQVSKKEVFNDAFGINKEDRNVFTLVYERKEDVDNYKKKEAELSEESIKLIRNIKDKKVEKEVEQKNVGYKKEFNDYKKNDFVKKNHFVKKEGYVEDNCSRSIAGNSYVNDVINKFLNSSMFLMEDSREVTKEYKRKRVEDFLTYLADTISLKEKNSKAAESILNELLLEEELKKTKVDQKRKFNDLSNTEKEMLKKNLLDGCRNMAIYIDSSCLLKERESLKKEFMALLKEEMIISDIIDDLRERFMNNYADKVCYLMETTNQYSTLIKYIFLNFVLNFFIVLFKEIKFCKRIENEIYNYIYKCLYLIRKYKHYLPNDFKVIMDIIGDYLYTDKILYDNNKILEKRLMIKMDKKYVDFFYSYESKYSTKLKDRFTKFDLDFDEFQKLKKQSDKFERVNIRLLIRDTENYSVGRLKRSWFKYDYIKHNQREERL